MNDIHVYEDKNLDIYPDKLIQQGRAKTNMLGEAAPRLNSPEWEIRRWEDGYDIDGHVYVSALGDVIDGCDWSWNEAKKHKLGSIIDEPIEDIVLRYAHEEEKR